MRGLDDANHKKSSTADQDRFTNRIRRQIEFLDRVAVDETHLPLAVDVDRRKRPSLFDEAILHHVPIGPDACDGDALDPFVARLNIQSDFGDRRHRFHKCAFVANCADFRRLEENLLPRVHVARRVVRAIGKDEELARADRFKLREHFRFEARERRDNRGRTRNADDDSERRKKRP